MAAWGRNDGPKFQPKRDDLEDLHRATDALISSRSDQHLAGWDLLLCFRVSGESRRRPMRGRGRGHRQVPINSLDALSHAASSESLRRNARVAGVGNSRRTSIGIGASSSGGSRSAHRPQ
jgi:hypothetical protein